MKKELLFGLICFFAGSLTVMSKAGAKDSKYNIAFADTVYTLDKEKNKDVVYQFKLNAKNNKQDDFKDHKVSVAVDEQNSTLPQHDYEIDFRETAMSSFNADNFFYVKIKGDSIEDRPRTLILKLKVKKTDGKDDATANNEAKERYTRLIITVNSYKPDSLTGYNYLAYVGTNFDLVDGIKPKNLFFATNIFVPPSRKKTIGFSMTLYGNRTMTTTDTSGKSSYTSKLQRLNDTMIRHYYSVATKTQTRVSDNLGAYFSALVRLGGASNERNKIQLYYAPSLEFIWRRATTTLSYTDPQVVDSSDNEGKMYGTLETPNKIVSNMSIFDLYAGYLGFMIRHESSLISFRLQLTAGSSVNYTPMVTGANVVSTKYVKTNDLFFIGRVWVTEPVSGITVEAEITNNQKYPRPYYGVTLSKAINLKNLGTIFQPVTSR